MNTLIKQLQSFKLAGMANNIKERLHYAQQEQLSYQELIELLCEDEQQSRQSNSYRKRLNKAKLPAQKTFEDFDFSFQPSIDKKQVNDISTCQFIQQARNVIFIGQPGTGKTHLATAIGMRALSKGYKVFFTSVAEMLYQLHMAKADNSYYKKLQEYLQCDLLILDELGFKTLPDYAANDCFEVISKRYEKGAMVITTNKPFDQWKDIFSDETLTSAILDRVVHHAITFYINGKSYRAQNIQPSQQKTTE